MSAAGASEAKAAAEAKAPAEAKAAAESKAVALALDGAPWQLHVPLPAPQAQPQPQFWFNQSVEPAHGLPFFVICDGCECGKEHTHAGRSGVPDSGETDCCGTGCSLSRAQLLLGKQE